MSEQTPVTTEQVHGNLKGILLNGRILVNGLPLTANEIAVVIQGEQMIFEKAIKFDQATALAAKKQQDADVQQASDQKIQAEEVVKKQAALKLVEAKPEVV